MQSAPPRPLTVEERQDLALDRIDHREIPDQDVDMERAAPVEERVEKRRQFGRHRVLGRRIAAQPHPAMDVPADNEDRALGPQHRHARRREIGGCVDEERCSLRRFDAPTVSPRAKYSLVLQSRPSFAVGLYITAWRWTRSGLAVHLALAHPADEAQQIGLQRGILDPVVNRGSAP